MTKQREIKALIKLSEVYDINNLEIVTWDEEDIVEINTGIVIRILPIYKWLLREENLVQGIG